MPKLWWYFHVRIGQFSLNHTKLLIYGLFQKGRVLAQDGVLKRGIAEQCLRLLDAQAACVKPNCGKEPRVALFQGTSIQMPLAA